MNKQKTVTSCCIRDYQEADRSQVCQCFSALQEYERVFEPRRKHGAALAETYVEDLIEQCRVKNGKILVAIVEGELIGFACVFCDERLDEELNENIRIAYVSDLYVKEELRGSGIGKALMMETEKFAKQSGASSIMLNVLADNHSTRQFYANIGYEEYEIKLEKPL